MSINKDKFHKKYNHLQMDKYLIESEKIKDKIQRVKFWNDLMINYKKDLNELKNINSAFGALISLDNEFRYKKGGLLSSDFEAFCKSQIEQLKYESLQTLDPKIKDRVNKKIALSTFFKVSNEVLDPEPIDKPISINYDNWNALKDQFFNQRMKSYNESLTIAEKTKLETNYLNKLVSINENESILKGKETDQFRILVDRYKSLLTENVDKLPIIKKEPEFNPNHFNKDAYLLFEYLLENYVEIEKQRVPKVKFMNVWFFLNDLNEENKYLFDFTKDQYKEFIKSNYEVEINNTDKPENYNEKQHPKMRNHRINFENQCITKQNTK